MVDSPDLTETMATEQESIEQLNNKFDGEFAQLMELMHYLLKEDTSRENPYKPDETAVNARIADNANLGFTLPGTTTLYLSEHDTPQLGTAVLNLYGSNTPLPAHYADNIALEAAQGEPHLAHFLDLFNQRLISLLHQIWRKYQYSVTFDHANSDQFSQSLFALLGIGSEAAQEALPVNHNKMLAYAGILASPGRSAEIVCSLVMHCFDLTHVSLQTWQLRWVNILEEQLTRLGIEVQGEGNRFEQRSKIGTNFVLGRKVLDYSGKFMLTLSKLTFEQFIAFAPTVNNEQARVLGVGANHQALTTLISFIMRDQLAWSLQLQLAKREMRPMYLGDPLSCLLGYTCYIPPGGSEPASTFTIHE